jgi:tRNA/tmRNA/rRNA uracil-C5-methylase (TrmA/RlmC/RlmD family)
MEILLIDTLGNGVGGVARPHDKPVTFVRGGLPGEKVACEVTFEKPSYRVARLLEVLEPSSSRVEPPCPLYPECGGCSMQHLAYEAQITQKRQWVEMALRKSVSPSAVRETVRSPLQLGYRNRGSFDVTGGRTGLHRHRGEAFPARDCLLLGDRGREMLGQLGAFDLSFSRRVCVRSSLATRSDALEFTQCTRCGPVALPGVETAYQAEGGWTTPDGWSYTERLSGILYSIPPSGFFQVNTSAAALLVEEVLRSTRGASSVLDIYGGVGTFAIPAAQAGARLTSVDRSLASCDAGASSALRAGVADRVDFLSLDSREFLTEAADSGGSWDAAVLDPPRGGLEALICRLVMKLAIPRIIYVSCDPQTLARDLKTLQTGYDVCGVTPFDLFPQTDSVETVTVLERRKGGS